MLAAFSVFFTQSSSFLQHQSLMKQNKGKDNAQSLFKLSKIPCDNQIRKLLDPIINLQKNLILINRDNWASFDCWFFRNLFVTQDWKSLNQKFKSADHWYEI